jgi:hypothetical protein
MTQRKEVMRGLGVPPSGKRKEVKMRTIVLSDAHGRLDFILNAVEDADYKWGEDRLIFAGGKD